MGKPAGWRLYLSLLVASVALLAGVVFCFLWEAQHPPPIPSGDVMVVNAECALPFWFMFGSSSVGMVAYLFAMGELLQAFNPMRKTRKVAPWLVWSTAAIILLALLPFAVASFRTVFGITGFGSGP